MAEWMNEWMNPEMFSINSGTIVLVLKHHRPEHFPPFVTRLVSLAVITRSSAVNLQVRIMPLHIFAYLSPNACV